MMGRNGLKLRDLSRIGVAIGKGVTAFCLPFTCDFLLRLHLFRSMGFCVRPLFLIHFLKARTSYIQSQRDKNEKDDKQGDISNFIFHNNFLDVSEPLCRSKLRITHPAGGFSSSLFKPGSPFFESIPEPYLHDNPPGPQQSSYL